MNVILPNSNQYEPAGDLEISQIKSQNQSVSSNKKRIRWVVYGLIFLGIVSISVFILFYGQLFLSNPLLKESAITRLENLKTDKLVLSSLAVVPTSAPPPNYNSKIGLSVYIPASWRVSLQNNSVNAFVFSVQSLQPQNETFTGYSIQAEVQPFSTAPIQSEPGSLLTSTFVTGDFDCSQVGSGDNDIQIKCSHPELSLLFSIMGIHEVDTSLQQFFGSLKYQSSQFSSKHSPIFPELISQAQASEQIGGIPVNSFIPLDVDGVVHTATFSAQPDYKNGPALLYSFQGLRSQYLNFISLEEDASRYGNQLKIDLYDSTGRFYKFNESGSPSWVFEGSELDRGSYSATGTLTLELPKTQNYYLLIYRDCGPSCNSASIVSSGVESYQFGVECAPSSYNQLQVTCTNGQQASVPLSECILHNPDNSQKFMEIAQDFCKGSESSDEFLERTDQVRFKIYDRSQADVMIGVRYQTGEIGIQSNPNAQYASLFGQSVESLFLQFPGLVNQIGDIYTFSAVNSSLDSNDTTRQVSLKLYATQQDSTDLDSSRLAEQLDNTQQLFESTFIGLSALTIRPLVSGSPSSLTDQQQYSLLLTDSTTNWEFVSRILTLYKPYTFQQRADFSSDQGSSASSFALLLCRKSGFSTYPNTRTQYESALETMNKYWQEVSYGQFSMDGSMVAPGTNDGWYDEIATGNSDQTPCASAAESTVNFPSYDGIMEVHNQTTRTGSGQVDLYQVLNGVPKSYHYVTATAQGSNPYKDSLPLMLHEMGHTLTWQHSIGAGQEYMSYWDLMGYFVCPNHGMYEFGCLPMHPIAFHKYDQGWIPPQKIKQVEAGQIEVLKLEQHAVPSSKTDTVLIGILPIDENSYYTLETRYPEGSDQALNIISEPEAVLIHLIERHSNGYFYPEIMDGDGNDNPLDDGVAWIVGEQFIDESNGLSISIESQFNQGFMVKVIRN